jgi:uncharacterized protein YjbJ (UPF0337 family)
MPGMASMLCYITNTPENAMNHDQIKGRVEEVKGNVKQAAGKAKDDKGLQVKGKFEKVGGKVQASYGDAKEDIKKADKS